MIMRKYEITKDQIETLSITDHGDTKIKLKEWFPEAFETVLEVGKWYTYRAYNDPQNDGICFVTKKPVLQEKLGFGINGRKEWREEFTYLQGYVFKEATESEVFEALKNEAVKRGYDKENTFVKSIFFDEREVNLSCSGYDKTNFRLERNGEFIYNGVTIFKNGKWAEIIPTITKQEAEKQLGMKIID